MHFHCISLGGWWFILVEDAERRLPGDEWKGEVNPDAARAIHSFRSAGIALTHADCCGDATVVTSNY